MANRALAAAQSMLASLEPWSESELEARLRALAEERDMKTGDLFMMLRVAATGSKVSPPLVATLDALGKDEVLHRVDYAASKLREQSVHSGQMSVASSRYLRPLTSDL